MAPNRLLIFSPAAFQLSGHQQSYLTGLGEAPRRGSAWRSTSSG